MLHVNLFIGNISDFYFISYNESNDYHYKWM